MSLTVEMPPRHDPTVYIPGITAFTHFVAKLARSLAFSRTVNPRNLEHYWYPLWCRLLVDLVHDTPNLLVYPQFPLWIVDHPHEAQEPEQDFDGDEVLSPSAQDLEQDESREQRAEEEFNARDERAVRGRKAKETRKTSSIHSEQGHGDDGSSEEEVGELVDTVDHEDEGGPPPTAERRGSDAQSGNSLPAPNTKGRVADFAIVHVEAAPSNVHPARYGGWRISKESVPLLVEIKRGPSRHLKGAPLEEAPAANMLTAKQAVLTQATFAFLSHTELQSIKAIAAAGPYWSSATIRHHNLPNENWRSGGRSR
ncbi:hypothetical protein BV25DRAFT_1922718 [Artomyces pyxidatus]|uniref:Uncharacterized protein n=1 Tax=Artomyces pyxidatus TaxID=48021 RepID=A0ACB8SDQ0_9AGAM|nr:hypothetical protein BV25DRAFT_1922718 [Artomyces pyxidatus]